MPFPILKTEALNLNCKQEHRGPELPYRNRLLFITTLVPISLELQEHRLEEVALLPELKENPA